MADLFPKTNSISPKEPIKKTSSEFLKTQKTNSLAINNKMSSEIRNKESVKVPSNIISNFETFIKLLNKNSLENIFSSFMFIELDHMIKSSKDSSFSKDLLDLKAAMKLNPDEVLQSFKQSILSSNKFSNSIFSVLRNAISSNIPDEIKYSIIEFIRCYDNTSSNNHILTNIIANLKNISLNMNSSYSKHLDELINQLSTAKNSASNPSNINLLKNDIVPFLANYIKRSRDFGHIRDLISIFTANLSKYESGTMEQFDNKLNSLFLYKEISTLFTPLTSSKIKDELLFKNNINNSKLDVILSKITNKAINDDNGTTSSEIFSKILTSTLINKSVYLPLLYSFFPLATDDNMMFSQIFIDTNEENENIKANITDETKPIKCFIRFYIKDLGPFEMILTLQDNQVGLSLNYPQYISAFKNSVKSNITDLIKKNNLKLSNLSLEEYVSPSNLIEVFPKIYDRKDSINVKI